MQKWTAFLTVRCVGMSQPFFEQHYDTSRFLAFRAYAFGDGFVQTRPVRILRGPLRRMFPRRFPYSIRPDYRRIRSRSSVTVPLTERLRFLYHNADRICRQGGREL